MLHQSGLEKTVKGMVRGAGNGELNLNIVS